MARTKILLADDQDRVRRLVAATLGSAQWELLYASDGEEALRIAPETPAIVTTLAQTGSTGNTTTITAPEAQQLLAYARDLNQSLEQVRRVYAELERSYLQTIEALAAALDARDSATEGHCQRVTGCTLILGEAMGVTGANLRALHCGAALHDIGKIGIPDAILLKPGRLTEEEWTLMRQHPALGEKIIAGIEFLRSAVPVVLHHHERWDGGGYPFGLRGGPVPMDARIFSV